MSAHAVYLRDWRMWRTETEGRCEALCSSHNSRRGKRCTYSGAWCGTAGLILCRVHERKFDEATGFIRHVAA